MSDQRGAVLAMRDAIGPHVDAMGEVGAVFHD
jgi:hypothetical protein